MLSPVSGVTLRLEPSRVGIRRGALIGGKALNPKSPYQREYHFGDSFILDPSELEFSLRDELVQQGYRMVSKGAQQRWRVYATVTKVIHNIFGSDSALGWSEAQVTVQWRLVGPREVRVTTSGVANERKHSRASLFQAWRRAIRGFGGHPKVVAALRTDVQAGIVTPTQPIPNGISRVVEALPASLVPLPDATILQRLGGSVVTVIAREKRCTGVVLSNTGLVLTAIEAVKGLPNAVLIAPTGKRIAGRIVAIDPGSGTALIQANPGYFRAVPFRLTADVLGERVIAIGPADPKTRASNAVTGFITSAPPGELDTNVLVTEPYLGAPIVDSFGRMVGLVTGYSANGSAHGVPTKAIFSGLNITVTQ